MLSIITGLLGNPEWAGDDGKRAGSFADSPFVDPDPRSSPAEHA